jgi:hypothetical protein
MSVIKSIEDGLKYAFTTRERPIEPAMENLLHLTLVGTVNMERSLLAHPGRAAVDQSNLPALRAVPKTLQASGDQQPQASDNNVVHLPPTALEDTIERSVSAGQGRNATVSTLPRRAGDVVMGNTVDTIQNGPQAVSVSPEELRNAA